MDDFYMDKDETFTLPCLASYMRAVLPSSLRNDSSESCSESEASDNSDLTPNQKQ
jgi:hypothetical protein